MINLRTTSISETIRNQQAIFPSYLNKKISQTVPRKHLPKFPGFIAKKHMSARYLSPSKFWNFFLIMPKYLHI